MRERTQSLSRLAANCSLLFRQLKVLLARRAGQLRYSDPSAGDSGDAVMNDILVPSSKSDSLPSVAATQIKRKTGSNAMTLPPPKKSKASSPNSVATCQNFLQIGARKAMEAKSARHAARVGYDRSKKNKKSHTGSGVPLSRVLRLKFVKGYTEAVRTPCYAEDLL